MKLSYAAFGKWLNVVNVISFIAVDENSTIGTMSLLGLPNPIALPFAF